MQYARHCKKHWRALLLFYLGSICVKCALKMEYLPDDYDILSHPLFQLPKHNVPLRGSRHRRLPPISRKQRAPVVRKTLSYTALRREREEFRKKLIKLIIRPDDGCPDDIPSPEEKEFLRYYYYIHHGIDTVHVAPLQPRIMKRVFALISSKLLKWSNSLNELTSEIKEYYLVAVKKAIVDFVLQDSSKAKDKIIQYDSAERRELKKLSIEWKGSFSRSKVKLHKSLNIINPYIGEVINIWFRKFRTLRLVDTNRLSKCKSALTLTRFEADVRAHLSRARDMMLNDWLPSIKDMLARRQRSRARARSRSSKHRLRPTNDLSFYDTIACVMERQLQELCLNSARDYADYVADYGQRNRGIQINIVCRKDGLIFEPSFKKIQTVFLDAFKFMVKIVKDIPRVDTNIDEDVKKVLKPIIPQDLIEKCRKEVLEVLEDNRIGPELLVQDFDSFIDLINGNIQQQMDQFFATEHPFEEYCELIDKFQSTSYKIPVEVEHVVTIGLYEMHREDLVQSLINAAIKNKDNLINWIITDYQNMMKGLSEEYQVMSASALAIPLDTAQLMAAAEFVRQAEGSTLALMQDRLRQVVKRLLFLSDHHALTQQEIKQNTEAFQWYLRMPQVFEEHRQMADIKTAEFQRGLKTRITQFGEELQRLDSLVNACRNWGDVTQLKKYRKRSTVLDQRLILAMETIKKFNTEETSFGYDLSSYPLQQEIHERLKPFKNLYDNCGDFLDKYDQWMKAKIGAYPPEDIQEEVEGYYKTVLALEENFTGKHPTTKDLAAEIRQRISEFRDHMPIVQTLGNQGMKPRHWEQVGEIVGFPIKAAEGELTLEKVIDYGFDDFVDRFVLVSEYATKENDLEEALNTMMSEWSDVQFRIEPYSDTGTFILASIDEIQVLLDDHIVKTQTMKSSPYIKPFESIINQWEQKLILLQEVLDEWLKVQCTWINFEPIFASPDIQQQMPEESRRFSAVDKIWREIMRTVRENTKVLVVVEIDKMLERLKKCNSLLDTTRRGLIDYLEKKRLFFPRFFFLANDELLDIISETKNPKKVQPHLRKCFEAVSTLDFTQEMDITKCKSHDDEVLTLTKKISTALAKGQVEKWLSELEKVLKESVKQRIVDVLQSLGNQSWEERLELGPGQALQVVMLINWSNELQKCLLEGHIIKQDISEECTKLIELLRQDLTMKNRLILRAMLKVLINNRDITQDLIDSKVSSAKDFKWMSQMKYFINDSSTILVRVFHYSVEYGYEYLGNCGRLVVTPLTLRYQRSVFGALHHVTGSAPEGPAATGKTETAKDLAKALARYCIVFNCSDRLDYAGLVKFLKGMASCGAWCCFDEFSRLSQGVLSAAAHYMQSILRAIRAGQNSVTLDGTQLRCCSDSHAFVTSVPPGVYRGRCTLPDNIKVLFRPISMTTSSYNKIAEIELYTYGCTKAKDLSTKLVLFYQLVDDLLPTQNQYDFGLRNIKAVLRLTGELLQNSSTDVEVLMVQSIKTVNYPKLHQHDIIIFNNLMTTIFPDINNNDGKNVDAFHDAVKECCAKAKLKFGDKLMLKVRQLYDTIRSRHGLIVLGPPMSGKTTICNVLADTLGLLRQNCQNEHKVSKVIIHPKAVTLADLFGQFDATREWHDGIFSINYKQFAASKNGNRKWLIFDGTMDTLWIENLNTVLDDNKKLCLMSGEIVPLPPLTNLIFETISLDLATPVTISRCSIVYLDNKFINWEDLIPAWINGLPGCITSGAHKDTLIGLFKRFVNPLMWFMENGDIKQTVHSGIINLVKSLMNILDCFMNDFNNDKYVEGLQDLDIRAQLEGSFFFSCIWSFGGSLDAPSKTKFSLLFRALLDKEFPADVKEQLKIPEQYCTSPPKSYIYIMPKDGNSVFDFKYIKEGKGKWRPWSDDLASNPAVIPRDIPVSQIIVPTTETLKITWLLSLLVPNKKPVLFIGPTSTGKTSYIANFIMKKTDTTTNIPATLNFSAQTNAADTQEFIMSRIDKRRKGIYGPPLGKCLMVFVDDLHLGVKQDQDFSPDDPGLALEILRGWLNYSTWKDLKTGADVLIQDVQILGAATLTRNHWDVDTRFSGLFSLISLETFGDTIITTIYSKIVLWHLDTRGFSKEFDPCISELVGATLAVYNATKNKLLPTPSNLQYKFNIRDYCRVIQGVLLSVPESTEGLAAIKRHWVHEVIRIYGDRMTNLEDKQWFYKQLVNVIQDELHETLDRIIPNCSTDAEIEADLDALVFCDFTKPLADVRFYKEVTSMDALLDVVEGYLIECNNMSKRPMTMVLCRYNIEHLSRICRVLKQSRGHVLLVGLPGSGKRSLARLAAHINDFEMIQIEMLKKYSVEDWKQDVKKIMQKVSVAEKHCVFMLSDNQLQEKCHLVDAVSLIRHGEVSGLLSADERAEAVEKARALDSQREKAVQTDGSVASLYELFLSQIREQLHVILTLSPAKQAFHKLARSCPEVINNCTINWFKPWPQSAFTEVAIKHLEHANSNPELDDTFACLKQEDIVKAFVKFHQTSQKVCKDFCLRKDIRFCANPGPASYLEMLTRFSAILSRNKKNLKKRKEQYVAAAGRLETTQKQIGIMQDKIEALKPQVSTASAQVQDITAKVDKETLTATDMEQNLLKQQAAVNKKLEATQKLRQQVDKEIQVVGPPLDEATAALTAMTNPDIISLKTIKNPPKCIKLVAEALCIIREVKSEKIQNPTGPGLIDDYWAPSKKMLSDPKFLESLLLLDKDDLPQHIMLKLQEKIENEEFDPEKVKALSAVGESFCKWIIALTKYDVVAQRIAPTKEELAKCENEDSVLVSNLEDKRNEFKEVQDKLAKLMKELEDHREHHTALNSEAELCQKKLERAEELLEGYGDDKDKMLKKAASLEQQLETLVGDALLSSAFLAYLGPLTQDLRKTSIEQWLETCNDLNILCNKDFSLRSAIGDEITVRSWLAAGLSSDEFVVDNALITTNCERWPLVVDPQGEGTKWIRILEKSRHLSVVRQTQGDYVRILENSIQFGQPILLENLGNDLDPILDSLLGKQTFKQSGGRCLKLGETLVDYNNDFKLFLATGLNNPRLDLYVMSKTTIINFTLTNSGLETKVLDIVLSIDKPDEQLEWEQYHIQQADNKRNLNDLEQQALAVLSLEENLLEEEAKIQTLVTSKLSVNEFVSKQKTAESALEELRESRTNYMELAQYITTVYMTIEDLSRIEYVYQYTIDWFLLKFKDIVQNVEKEDDIHVRMKGLITVFTLDIFRAVCRSLYVKDKLLLSFMLTINTLKLKNEVNHMELLAFLQLKKKSTHQDLKQKDWDSLICLEKCEAFTNITASIKDNESLWQLFAQTLSKSDLPSPWCKDLNNFQVLILSITINPDKTVNLIQKFVADNLGVSFLESPPFELKSVYQEADCCTPLMILLSPGVDPFSDIIKFGDTQGIGSDKLHYVSLGHGQDASASKLLDECMKNGYWAILQNCHLAQNWLKTLEKVYDNISPESVQPDFRLWMLSYPSQHIPFSILKNSIKLIDEVPAGLRSSIHQSYLSSPICENSWFRSSPEERGDSFKKLLYGLCFMHALLQQRSRYEAWNYTYEFCFSDMRTCAVDLKSLVDDSVDDNDIPFETLRYLTGECTYGGRLRDFWDKRCLNTLLQHFYCMDLLQNTDYTFYNTDIRLVPSNQTHVAHMDHTASLSLFDSTQAVGLGQNVEILKNQRSCERFFDDVLKTQELQQNLEYTAVLQKIDDILTKLPQMCDAKMLHAKYSDTDNDNVAIFLLQELEKYGLLVGCIRSTLDLVRLALTGSIIISESIEKVYKSLLSNQIPEKWLKYSYPSIKTLAAYIEDLIKRLNYLQKWVDEEAPPVVIWLSGLFSVTTYLTIIRINCARRYGVDVHKVYLDYKVQKEWDITDVPADGIYINGLYLEGAQWDVQEQILIEATSRLLYQEMPIILVLPTVKQDSISTDAGQGFYNCPLFRIANIAGKTPRYDKIANYVTFVPMEVAKKDDIINWILKRVSLLCDVF